MHLQDKYESIKHSEGQALEGNQKKGDRMLVHIPSPTKTDGEKDTEGKQHLVELPDIREKILDAGTANVDTKSRNEKVRSKRSDMKQAKDPPPEHTVRKLRAQKSCGYH